MPGAEAMVSMVGCDPGPMMHRPPLGTLIAHLEWVSLLLQQNVAGRGHFSALGCVPASLLLWGGGSTSASAEGICTQT